MFPTEPRLLQQQYGFGDLRIASVPLNVPVRTGWEWISLDVSGLRSGKNLNPDNDLRRSLAFGGSPWKVEVERVMGIEPTSVAWEATALPLSYARIADESLCGAAGVAQWWPPHPPGIARRCRAGIPGTLRCPGCCIHQKLPPTVAKIVASRARFWAAVVLRPTLPCRPNRSMRAPSTAVA